MGVIQGNLLMSLDNFLKRSFGEMPDAIAVHPQTLNDLKDEIRDNYRISSDMIGVIEYRGMRFIRSLDIKEGEFKFTV